MQYEQERWATFIMHRQVRPICMDRCMVRIARLSLRLFPDDKEIEGRETVKLRMQDSLWYTVGSPVSAGVVIRDSN